MNNSVHIVKPGPEDLDGTNWVFETVVRDAFQKEGLGHLEDEISGEILHKKKMLKEAVEEEGEVFFLVARLNGRIIGTISFGPCGEIIRECTGGALEGVGELGSLLILPELQSQGIGSQLIHAMIHELHRRGIEKFSLDSGYKRAQKRWVRKFGEPYMIVKDYWGTGSDHMIWLCSVSGFLSR
ncbi:GNAT family N-acetyltransferase [Proteiniclasticum sp. C24MP]|uniref:GNAT family N-acetyltransferase n=1 Tax=Proteiniclasticum sp. C24MP TaxID=3374101 RepID=UPI0037553E5B